MPGHDRTSVCRGNQARADAIENAEVRVLVKIVGQPADGERLELAVFVFSDREALGEPGLGAVCKNADFSVDDRIESDYGACATEKAWLSSEPGPQLTRLTSL